MATSGSDDYSVTRNDIVQAALRKVGQLGEGEVPTAQQTNDGADDLERMVKLWQAAGLHLWKYEEMILFLVGSQKSYDLGTTTTENWLKESDLVSTTTAADAAISATAITVASITGIASGDIVGIITDDTTIHWDVVNGAPAGTTVTLTTGLDVAATSGAIMYAYTSRGVRPLQITQIRTQIDDNSEITHRMISRDEYFGLANKAATGSAIQSYYNPRLGSGRLFPWPTAQDERQFLNVSAQISIEDFDGSGNSPDFPAEWFDPLVWGLAERFLSEYGVIDPVTVQLVTSMAARTYEMAEDFDSEDTSLVFRPDMETD